MLTEIEKERMKNFFSHLAWKDFLRSEIEDKLQRELAWRKGNPPFQIVDERMDELPYE